MVILFLKVNRNPSKDEIVFIYNGSIFVIPSPDMPIIELADYSKSNLIDIRVRIHLN